MLFCRQRMNKDKALVISFLKSPVTTFSGIIFLIILATKVGCSRIILSEEAEAQIYSIGAIQLLLMQQQSEVLREVLKIKIEQLFKGQQSPKVLYIHKDLLDLLNFCYGFKLQELLEKGDKIIHFEQDNEATDTNKDINNVLFFLNPLPSAMRTVSSLILRNQAKSILKKYTLWLVPKVDHLCVDMLSNLQILNKIQVKSFNFGLVPLHCGLTTLQLNINCDQVEVINCSVEALLKMCKLAGSFGSIIGKGQKARIVLQKFEKRFKEDELNFKSKGGNSCLIVLDRKMDLLTPLVTAHSYEALLDHYFGINLNCIMVPGTLLNHQNENLEPYLLNNKKDPVYDHIRHLTIEEARDFLTKTSEQTKTELSQRKDAAKSIEELEQVMKTVGVSYEQIQNHKAIIEFLMTKMGDLHFYNLVTLESSLLDAGKIDLEDLHYLSLQYPAEHILRLICLYSQVSPNASFYSKLERELLEVMVHNYPPSHIYSLYKLQKIGLLRNSKAKNKWEQISQLLDLIPVEQHSYTKVHVLYSALSVRFVELTLKNKLEVQTSAVLGRDNFVRGLQRDKKITEVYIFYMGGVTYGQISCLRILQKQMGIKFHILSTNVASGYETIRNNLANPHI